MMNIAQFAVSKAVVAFVTAAMIFTMFAGSARAQSVEDLQKMINDLMAQISALQSGSGSTGSMSCGPWTRDLNTGATGADVKALQQYLNRNADTRVAASGVGSAGMETEYYGPATAAAVSKFQVMYMADILTPAGLVSPTGFFGPSTRAKMNALCATAVVDEDEDDTDATDEDEDDTTTSLEGGEGSIVVEVITDGAADVDLGKAETVIEMEVEAQDSDVSVSRVDFTFNARPWLYFSEVNLLVDGEVVATLDGSTDFSEVGSNYRARFTGLDIVVREDEVAEVALEVVPFGSLNATRLDDTVTVTTDADGVRFVDAAGITDTDGDSSGSAAITFTDVFDEGTVDVSVSDESPEDATIVVDETDRTEATVAIFEVEAEDANMEVTDVSVDVTVAGTANTPNNVLYRAYLMNGETELDRFTFTSNTVGGTETATFDDLEIMVEEDETIELSVVLDFEAGEDMGTTTSASFTIGDIEVTAENENFASVTDTVTVGETHTIIENGITLEVGNKSTAVVTNTTTADASYGEYRINFEVTAVGDDVWVPLTAVRNASTTAGVAFRIEDSNGGAVTVGTTTESLTRVSGGSVTGGFVKINEGQTAEFQVYVTYNPATAGQFRVQMLTAGFNDTSAATPNASQTATPAEDFETNNQNVTS